MNKFKWWLFEKICEDIVIQGNHEEYITKSYKIIYQAANKYFTEENQPGLEGTLGECFDKAKCFNEGLKSVQ